ncbi:FadR family transcriptional regulator [Ramlibacter sp. G-1-2-2]|uniref:FadR family transcriptional regulator n=1 Tax=Ramlibacter agri TaxID=2728837 RepID=A0A848H557_9BURK|nr:FCD domain-containing protein [Ramlibacter agri]NML44661.1 FadR family transcriptional regulator [Ramlibacter agri]
MSLTNLNSLAYEGICELIEQRGLTTNDRLPSEVEMVKLLGISRPILRQALERLKSEGRLYAVRGSGNYVGSKLGVSPLSFGPFGELDDLKRFMEFRLILEGEAAALAAVSANAEAVELVTKRRLQLDARLALQEHALEEDIAFHMAVAAASGNRYFELATAACMEQIRVSIQMTKDILQRAPAVRANYVSEEHRLIDEAIRSGDPAAARNAMIKHLRRGLVRLFGG